MLLIKAIDDDYFIEFKEDLSLLGQLIGHNDSLMKTAINNGLDINWIISGEIPDDIVAIHKEIKHNELLK